MRVKHSNAKPHGCNMCHKSYKYASGLSNHKCGFD